MKSHSPPPEPKPENFSLSQDDLKKIEKFNEKGLDSSGKLGCSVYLGGCFLGAAMGSQFGSSGLVGGFILGTFLNYLLLNMLSSKTPLPSGLKERYDNYQDSRTTWLSESSEYSYKQKDYWFSMSGHKFEHEFGKLLEKEGYAVTLTKGSGDGGIDLVATKGSQEIIIQCKAWKNPVGPAPIREMQGVKEDHQQVWVVGLGGFTTGAIEFAKQKDIKLLEYKDVDAMVQRKFASKNMKQSIDMGGKLIT